MQIRKKKALPQRKWPRWDLATSPDHRATKFGILSKFPRAFAHNHRISTKAVIPINQISQNSAEHGKRALKDNCPSWKLTLPWRFERCLLKYRDLQRNLFLKKNRKVNLHYPSSTYHFIHHQHCKLNDNLSSRRINGHYLYTWTLIIYRNEYFMSRAQSKAECQLLKKRKEKKPTTKIICVEMYRLASGPT